MDPPDPDPAVEPPPAVEGEKRDLTLEERRNIVSITLLLAVKLGDAEMNLQRGAIKSCGAAPSSRARTHVM